MIHIGPMPSTLPPVIVLQMYQGQQIQPELDSKLQYMYTLHEEIVHIWFQQEMLCETLSHLECCTKQLCQEYKAGS
jgi:hypothetical protein